MHTAAGIHNQRYGAKWLPCQIFKRSKNRKSQDHRHTDLLNVLHSGFPHFVTGYCLYQKEQE